MVPGLCLTFQLSGRSACTRMSSSPLLCWHKITPPTLEVPVRLPLHGIRRGVFQVMAVPGVEIKRGERCKRREGRGPERIHPAAQPGGTFGHHAQGPRAGQRFKGRPDLDRAAPEHLEGLEEIAPAAPVGEHAIHAPLVSQSPSDWAGQLRRVVVRSWTARRVRETGCALPGKRWARVMEWGPFE